MVPLSDKRPFVRAKEINKEKNGREGKIRRSRKGAEGKMTRYGVCLILERGEVSSPEGLQPGGGDVSLLVRVWGAAT